MQSVVDGGPAAKAGRARRAPAERPSRCSGGSSAATSSSGSTTTRSAATTTSRGCCCRTSPGDRVTLRPVPGRRPQGHPGHASARARSAARAAERSGSGHRCRYVNPTVTDAAAPLVLVSNRGPVTYHDDGSVTARHRRARDRADRPGLPPRGDLDRRRHDRGRRQAGRARRAAEPSPSTRPPAATTTCASWRQTPRPTTASTTSSPTRCCGSSSTTSGTSPTRRTCAATRSTPSSYGYRWSTRTWPRRSSRRSRASKSRW